MRLLLALFLNALALIITTYIVPGFEVTDFWAALLAAIILGAANTFIRPLLLFLTAPLNVVTLGLFTFVVNAIMLRLVDIIVPGLTIDSFIIAIVAAVVLAVVSTALNMVLGDLKKLKR